MKLLLDTHLLLWALLGSRSLSKKASRLILDPENDLYFSSISIWEMVIKRAMDAPDFQVDPYALRGSLMANGYTELPFASEHALRISGLPLIHKDPFDRALLGQASSEGIALVTADKKLSGYPGLIIRV